MISEGAGADRGWSGDISGCSSRLDRDVHAVEPTRGAPKVGLLSSLSSRSGRRSGYGTHPSSSVSVASFVLKLSPRERHYCGRVWSKRGVANQAMHDSLVFFFEVASRGSAGCCPGKKQVLPNGTSFRFHVVSLSIMAHGSTQILRLRLPLAFAHQP